MQNKLNYTKKTALMIIKTKKYYIYIQIKILETYLDSTVTLRDYT